MPVIYSFIGKTIVPATTRSKDIQARNAQLGRRFNATRDQLVKTKFNASAAQLNPISLLSMNSPSITEGDTGSSNMTFQVVRASDGGGVISFSYTTIAGTATAGVDYVTTAGSTIIASGGTVNIIVPIIGDVIDENDETLTMRISNVAYV